MDLYRERRRQKPLFALYFCQVKLVKAKKKRPHPSHCFLLPLCDSLLAGVGVGGGRWRVGGCQAGVINTTGGALQL
jgi:hypothetical protein